MTNPGHVDPGFKGQMAFTVINMSEVNFQLLKKNKIVTLLFFELRQDVTRDLEERLEEDDSRGGKDSVGKLLGVLSSDFLGISARVKAVAESEEEKTRREVLRAETKTRRSTLIGQVGLAVVGIIATCAVLILGSFAVLRGEISDLKAKVESSGEAQEVRKQVRVKKQVQVRSGREIRSQAAGVQNSVSP